MSAFKEIGIALLLAVVMLTTATECDPGWVDVASVEEL